MGKSQSSTESVGNVLDMLYSLIQGNKENEAIQCAVAYMLQNGSSGEVSCDIAEIYRRVEQITVLRGTIQHFIQINKGRVLAPEYKILRTVVDGVFDIIKKNKGARNKYFISKENSEIKDQPLFRFYFDKLEKFFGAQLLSMPYKQRELIVPVKSYDGINWATYGPLQVININNLPKIDFPEGPPIENRLYVGHPRVPDKYILFDGYVTELTKERIKEYCHIMQSLGATEINIEGIDCSGASTGTRANQFLRSISQNIQLHQIYHPKKAPKLPTDLVWYHSELSWQVTYKQRMHESLLECEEKFDSEVIRKEVSINLKTVSHNYEKVISDIGVEYKQSMEEQFKHQENVVFSIKVKFAPLESLPGYDSAKRIGKEQ